MKEAKNIGTYTYVAPESDAEKKVEDKKHPKDRLLSVDRMQKYEVTLQDMFAMRLHYKQEGLQQLKEAIEALNDYEGACTQVVTWETQIAQAMKDLPELAENNVIPEEEIMSEETSKQFKEIKANLEQALMDAVPKPAETKAKPVAEVAEETKVVDGEENLETKK